MCSIIWLYLFPIFIDDIVTVRVDQLGSFIHRNSILHTFKTSSTALTVPTIRFMSVSCKCLVSSLTTLLHPKSLYHRLMLYFYNLQLHSQIPCYKFVVEQQINIVRVIRSVRKQNQHAACAFWSFGARFSVVHPYCGPPFCGLPCRLVWALVNSCPRHHSIFTLK